MSFLTSIPTAAKNASTPGERVGDTSHAVGFRPHEDAKYALGTQKVFGMQHITAARSQIGPLLDALILQLEVEGSATQKAHFKRIRGRLYGAHDAWELTTPMIELSTCIAMGFHFSKTADALISRILQKAAVLVGKLEGVEPRIH